jgi:hypothetical protein
VTVFVGKGIRWELAFYINTGKATVSLPADNVHRLLQLTEHRVWLVSGEQSEVHYYGSVSKEKDQGIHRIWWGLGVALFWENGTMSNFMESLNANGHQSL